MELFPKIVYDWKPDVICKQAPSYVFDRVFNTAVHSQILQKKFDSGKWKDRRI